MPSFRPLIASLLMTLLLSVGFRRLLRRFFPALAARPVVDWLLKALPWMSVGAVLTWTVGNVAGLRGVSLVGASLTGLLIMLLLPQLLAIPMAGGLRQLLSWLLLPPQEQGVLASVSTSAPATVPVTQPVTQAVTQPVTLPVSQAVTQPVTLPVSQPAEVEKSSFGEPSSLSVLSPSVQEREMSSSDSRSSAAPEGVEASSLLTTAAFSRRQFIRAATGAVPVAAFTSSLSGVAMAAQPREMPFVEMFYPDLPPELDGLRILHFSDVHLGVFVRVDDIERGLEQAAPHKPDLIVLTGDVADDLSQLEPALRLIAASKPRLGAFGAIGNHEYFRGFRETRQIYDRTDVPLLLESGHTLQVGGARLHIGGVNDPISLRRDSRTFMEQTFDKTFDGAPSDAFQLALSHRPEGFIAASQRNIQLTLSGHTHGGQLGINGRSLFEPLAEDKFLWGKYSRGQSRLYTSAGFGHWLPFRIGCPAEAPIIVLRRGTGTPA